MERLRPQHGVRSPDRQRCSRRATLNAAMRSSFLEMKHASQGKRRENFLLQLSTPEKNGDSLCRSIQHAQQMTAHKDVRS
jgi:hypothetical protein